MKRNIKKLSFLFLTIFAFNLNIDAECNDDELNNWAEKVEIVFKEFKAEQGDENQFAYTLTATPYNEKVTAKVKSTYSKDFFEVEYDKDYNGYALGSELHHQTKKYIFRFYGNDTCDGELLREIEYEVPAYNLYSLTDICQEDEYKNTKICKMNTDTSDITVDEFNKEIKKITENNRSAFYKIFKGVIGNWYYAFIPFVLVAAVYTYKVYGFKKEQSKK